MCQHSPADRAVTTEGESKREAGKGGGGKCMHTLNTCAAPAHGPGLEGNESETHIRTPHAARLSESSRSQASIQFIREPLAAALV